MKHILKLARKLGSECSYPFSHYWGYFKGYWFIKFITILIVLVLILAVLVQIFKSTNWFAMWFFTFLSEWAMVLSTSVMLMLAGAAIWAIMDNRYARIVDRNELLLNEIIKWAEDVRKCESLSQLPMLPILDFKTAGQQLADVLVEHTNRVTIANLGLRYQAIDARSEDMKIVAKKLDKSLGSNLYSAVHRTAKKLGKNLEMIDKLLKGGITEQEYKDHWLSLVKSANALAKKAASLTE